MVYLTMLSDSNDGMISTWWIRNVMEGSFHGI